MRIDKYLWCIRVYKTRTKAAEQCKLAKVWVNDELIKASRELKFNEVVKVRKGPVHFSFCVISFPTSRVGAKLVSLYALDVTPKEELEKLLRNLLIPKDTTEQSFDEPSRKSMGWAPYALYVSVLCFVHHFYLVLIEWLQFGNFVFFIGKVAGTTAISLLMIFMVEMLFGRKGKSRAN